MEIRIYITSAVISAIVSGAVILLNGWLGRVEERRLSAFQTALELAKEHRAIRMKLAENTNEGIELQDLVVLTGLYFKHTLEIMSTGRIPKEVLDEEKKSAGGKWTGT